MPHTDTNNNGSYSMFKNFKIHIVLLGVDFIEKSIMGFNISLVIFVLNYIYYFSSSNKKEKNIRTN